MPDPDLKSPYTPPPRPAPADKPKTRMAPRLAPLPKVYDREVDKTKKAVAKVATKKVSARLAAAAPVDDQFKARVTFSEAFGDDAGQVWSEPLEIEDRVEWAGREFFWRLEIDQFRVDPLLQGFKTVWTLLTPGWTFVDGLGSTLYDEAISNPVAITRVIKAPGTFSVRPKFRVVVAEKYQP